MENSVIGFRFAINISVSYTESYCFYPMTKIFYKDGTSGWHGHKNGLALFYVDQQHFQQEFHETSLTSNMNSYFQLMIKQWL